MGPKVQHRKDRIPPVADGDRVEKKREHKVEIQGDKTDVRRPNPDLPRAYISLHGVHDKGKVRPDGEDQGRNQDIRRPTAQQVRKSIASIRCIPPKVEM